ncbi:MAG TPA: ABC transporter permease [Gemmatimonadaceae bacterium]|nr:ABC transporter permease [Gemmatimonadaceae bacterium]
MTPRRIFSLGFHRPSKARAEMRDELAFHLEERVGRLVARGMSPEAARAEAMRRLGTSLADIQHTLGDSAERKEKTLSMRDWMQDLAEDVRYALRGLARRPGFTTVAIVTLAIGIGGNTAIYSAVDALLLRSLPFAEPDRLMDIAHVGPEQGYTAWSYVKAKVFTDAQQSFSSTALYSNYPGTLTGADPERVGLETVSASYLRTLGVRVARGTDFAPELDAGPGAGAFAIISDALWQRRFAADPDVMHKSVNVNNQAYQILGVLPPGFRGVSGNADVMVNVTSRSADDLKEAWSLEFQMVGRLKPGVTPEQAAAETRRIGVEVYKAFPQDPGALTTAKSFAWGADARPLDSIRVATLLRRSLFVLFGAVGMVLLIACVNLANLLLARASARRREIAVRLAIGASRGRLVRLLLTESLVLSLAGGAAGVALAWWAARVLSTLNPQDALQAQNLSGGVGAVGFTGIHLDASALLFTLGVTVVVGMLFGLVPALGSTRADLAGGLKDDGAGMPAGRRALGFDRRALVIAEVSLAIVLLAGSGLMLRSLVNLMHINPGFTPDHVLTLRTNVPAGAVPPDSMPGFYEAVQARLGALPGVESVALTDCPPVSGGCNGTVMTFPDQPAKATGNMIVGVHWVSPNWFQTMRVPLRQGRMFDATDRRGTDKVVVINEEAARQYFKGGSPIGRRVAIYQGGFHTGATVIGVVGDVRFGTIDAPARPDAYISYAQSSPGRAMVFVRTTGDPTAIAATARAALRQVAPFSPIYDVKPMTDRMATATGQARLSALLLGMFAAVALALAVMGIYGVMSFSVAQRTREVGIRVALGADRGQVLRMFTREGVVLSAIGIAIGLGAAIGLTRVLRSLLFNVAPDDLVTFVGIAIVAAAAAVVASWIPARRAAALDPVRALK